MNFYGLYCAGNANRPDRKTDPADGRIAVCGVFALLRSLRCPCIGHSERAEKPAPPVILRRFSSCHPELVAARRQGRRRTAFAASPEAFAAPLPKKFFDTFWEPCKRRAEGSLFHVIPTSSRQGAKAGGALRLPPRPLRLPLLFPKSSSILFGSPVKATEWRDLA